MSRLPLLLAPLVATGLFELFFHYDWDEGVVRGGLVAALLALTFAARVVRFTPAPWPRWLRVTAFVGAGVLLAWHFKEGVLSMQRQRRSEMGDLHVRGVTLLRHGVTPWRFGTVLDLGGMPYRLQFAPVLACRAPGEVAPDAAALAAAWDSPRSGLELFPAALREPPSPGASSDTPACALARRGLALSGYKYGPVMMASYVPLVVLLGRGGEYVTHLVFLLLIIGAMAVLLRAQAPEALAMACVVLLGQSVLRRDTLYESDCDLIPTAMLLWALVAFEQQRSWRAGLLTGLGVAAKVFPSGFLVPLLFLGRRGPALAGFALVSLLAWAPAVALDGQGVWDNVFLFNLERDGDSTALPFFLSPAARAALTVVVLALGAWVAWRLAWKAFDPVAFVTFAAGLFFLVTRVFHNNYLVWWLPLVGVSLARAFSAKRGYPPAQ